MRDHLVGFGLAVLIVFLVLGAIAWPVLVWLGFVAVVLLAGIFIRLGRRDRVVLTEEDAKLYALAEKLEQTGGFPRSRKR